MLQSTHPPVEVVGMVDVGMVDVGMVDVGMAVVGTSVVVDGRHCQGNG